MSYRVEGVSEIADEEDLRAKVLDRGGYTAVVFGADWCPDCRRFAPTFTSLAEQYGGRLAFYRVSTQRCPDLEARYEIGLIPTVLLFRDARVVRTWEFIEDPAAYRAVFDHLPAG